MNPGVCPECGNLISFDTLDASPRSARRKRLVRSGVIAATIVGALFGANRFYASKVWYQWMSTSMLLESKPDSWPANNELFRRHLNGLLSESETYQLADRWIIVTLDIRSPHPSKASFAIRLKVMSKTHVNSPNGPDSVLDDSPTIRINDQDDSISDIHFVSYEPASRGWAYTYRCTSDSPLPAGKVRVHGTVPVQISVRGTYSSIPVPFQCNLTVEDEPMSWFVRPSTDNATRDLLRSQCAVSICPREDREFSVNLCVRKIDIPLAGRIEIRFDEQDAPIATSTFHTRADGKLDSIDIRFALPLNMDVRTTLIHVRFIPDLMLAFDAGYGACVGYTLDWTAIPLPVPDEDACNVCNCCNKPYVRGPDSVLRWEPKDE